jgi:hypothetical protein
MTSVGNTQSTERPTVAGEDPLVALAFLCGGTWTTEGRWPDGSPLRVTTRYSWGATGRVLHFVSHDLSGGEARLLYEGLLFHDPDRSTVAQWNVKVSGGIDRSYLTRADDSGFEVRGANTISLVRRVSDNECTWTLILPKEGQDQTILEATMRREALTT